MKGFWIKQPHEGSPCVSAHSKLNVCADSYKFFQDIAHLFLHVSCDFLNTFFDMDKINSTVTWMNIKQWHVSVMVEINQLPSKKMWVHDWAASKPLIAKNNQLLEWYILTL